LKGVEKRVGGSAANRSCGPPGIGHPPRLGGKPAPKR
jgi:hypothetical protein